MRKIHFLMLAVIAVTFGVGLYFSPQLPERVASHWNAQGEANGYFSKTWEMFLSPLVALGFLLLSIYLPRLEPMKESIPKNQKYLDGFFLLLILFFAYVHALTLAWGLGQRFNMTNAIIPAIGVLFFYCGILIEHAEQNWFVGIRTPWTLSSKTVWNKTHQIGGKLFQISGIITVFGVFVPEYSLAFLLVPVLFTVIFSSVYSYVEFQKEKRHG